MATPGRRTDSGLEASPLGQSLFQRGYEYDFFQAIRLLLRLYPGRKQVGGVAKPSQEVARFSGPVSLAFPPSAIDNIDAPADDSAPAHVGVAFMGLTGVMGVLPYHYTEHMIARKAAAFAAFLDIFNHRFVSLFYRAWAKHRPAALIEAAKSSGAGIDDLTQYLFDIVGMGTGGLRGRMRTGDPALLFYAGLIAQRPRSATALRAILRDYFGVPVEIDQFQGNWYPLEDPDRCYLSGASESNQLGVGAFAGSKVWDQQSRLRVRVGPVDLARFHEYLPGGAALGRMMEFGRFLLGPAVAFDVQVVLAAPSVPNCRLTSSGAEAPRLGWLGWLKGREFRVDAGDAVFHSDGDWALAVQ